MSSAIAGWGRQPGTRRAIAGLVSLALLVTASCAQSAASTLTADGDQASIIIVTGTGGEGDEAQATITRVESRHDLVDEQRILPDFVLVDPRDATRLVVRFDGGDPACHGARLAIDEQPATVRVLVFVGSLSEDSDGCATSSSRVEMVATLAHDLGTRELIWQR